MIESSDITHRAFMLYQKDIETLRSKVIATADIDLPIAYYKRIKKNDLIDTLLKREFGIGAFREYKRYCKEWDEIKWEEIENA